MSKQLTDGRSALRSLCFETEVAEDASGRTPLVALAEDLASQAPTADQKRSYAWAASQLARETPEWTDHAVEALSRFIQLSEFPVDQIADAFATALRVRLTGSSHVHKRAEITRLLTELGVTSLPIQLTNDTEMRQIEPWLWIDAMLRIDPTSAMQEISVTLEKGGSAENLLRRLPYLWSRFSPLTELPRWLEVLDETGRTRVRDWMMRRGIQPPGSQRRADSARMHAKELPWSGWKETSQRIPLTTGSCRATLAASLLSRLSPTDDFQVPEDFTVAAMVMNRLAGSKQRTSVSEHARGGTLFGQAPAAGQERDALAETITEEELRLPYLDRGAQKDRTNGAGGELGSISVSPIEAAQRNLSNQSEYANV
jgi:hypothetical protein